MGYTEPDSVSLWDYSPLGGLGEAQVPPNFEENVDAMAEKVLSCRDMVGLNLAVVQGEDTILTRGYGKVNLDRGDDVTPTTLFGIASLTKAFATTGLAVVMEESQRYGLTAFFYFIPLKIP